MGRRKEAVVTESLEEVIDKAKALWLEHDPDALKAYEEQLSVAERLAALRYEPYSKATDEFNAAAKLWEDELEAVKSARKTERAEAAYELFSALTPTVTVACIVAWITWTFDLLPWMSSSNMAVIYFAFGAVSITFHTFSLYFNGLFHRFKNKFPKDKSNHKAEAKAFREWTTALRAKTAVYAFTQIDEASALREAFSSLIKRNKEEAFKFTKDYENAQLSGMEAF